jgi:hypothetical protein
MKSGVTALFALRKYQFQILVTRQENISFPFLMAQNQNWNDDDWN